MGAVRPAYPAPDLVPAFDLHRQVHPFALHNRLVVPGRPSPSTAAPIPTKHQRTEHEITCQSSQTHRIDHRQQVHPFAPTQVLRYPIPPISVFFSAPTHPPPPLQSMPASGIGLSLCDVRRRGRYRRLSATSGAAWPACFHKLFRGRRGGVKDCGLCADV